MSNVDQITASLQQRKNQEIRAASAKNRKYRLIGAIGIVCSVIGFCLIYLALNWGFASIATAKAVFGAGVFVVLASFFPIFYGMTKQV
jgi:uncharacterized membrane protein